MGSYSQNSLQDFPVFSGHEILKEIKIIYVWLLYQEIHDQEINANIYVATYRKSLFYKKKS